MAILYQLANFFSFYLAGRENGCSDPLQAWVSALAGAIHNDQTQFIVSHYRNHLAARTGLASYETSHRPTPIQQTIHSCRSLRI
ncbi:MAG: hypothetical protein WCK77_09985 [Verrucomicrobiota bacterium]